MKTDMFRNLTLKEKFSKESLKFSCLLAAWIIVVNLAVILAGVEYSWPIFFTTILFFLQGADTKKTKQIFCGGLFGLFVTWLFVLAMEALTPLLGSFAAIAIPLVLSIFVIIVLGPLAPSLFNTEAFTFWTVCMINAERLPHALLNYAVTFVVGGGILLGGTFLIMNWTAKKESVS